MKNVNIRSLLFHSVRYHALMIFFHMYAFFLQYFMFTFYRKIVENQAQRLLNCVCLWRVFNVISHESNYTPPSLANTQTGN